MHLVAWQLQLSFSIYRPTCLCTDEFEITSGPPRPALLHVNESPPTSRFSLTLRMPMYPSSLPQFTSVLWPPSIYRISPAPAPRLPTKATQSRISEFSTNATWYSMEAGHRCSNLRKMMTAGNVSDIQKNRQIWMVDNGGN